ncbi:hypothetical protein ACMYYO_11515 [Dermacoccaceae bacterium W4C1]
MTQRPWLTVFPGIVVGLLLSFLVDRYLGWPWIARTAVAIFAACVFATLVQRYVDRHPSD